MADDRDDERRRMEDDRNRFGGQSQGQFSGAAGYGDQSRYGQGYGTSPQQGQTYGQAGGYSGTYGQGQPAYGGQSYGAGGWSPGGPEDWRGPQQGPGTSGGVGDRTQNFHGGQGGYTGQTGTGYGQSFGGAQGAPQRGHENFWDKAMDRVGSLLGGEEARGEHRGRGPKNYSRSDERIRDDVNDRLSEDAFLDASDIEVTVLAAEVTLDGTVSSREDKRRAEDLADAVIGVKHVQNNLRVARRDEGHGAERERSGLSLFGTDRESGTGQVG